MSPQPDDGMPGCVYYMTLLRKGDDLQLKVSEAVYLATDPRLSKAREEGGTMVRPIYRDVARQPRSRMDIFHIERLWITDR